MHDLLNGKSPDEVLRYLKGIQFPAKKDDVVHAARRAGAPADIIAALSELPRTDLATAEELIDLYPRVD